MTKQVLPKMASNTKLQCAVQRDHCFQRIILDNICNGTWYEHIMRPAYKYVNKKQALKAVKLCEGIIFGNTDQNALNRQSLIWRSKKGQVKNK